MSVSTESTERAQGSSMRTPRKLVVMWQRPATREMKAVGLLEFTGAEYVFNYLTAVREIEDFRPLLGFPDLESEYRSDELFTLFAQRAMDHRRPDYERYVTQLGLEEDATPWEQICRTGGRREGDTLQLFPFPERVGDRFEFSFLVHGMRYMWTKEVNVGGHPMSITHEEFEAVLSELSVGEALQLVPEPGNPFNQFATLVTKAGETPLGYVPDVLAADLAELRAADRADIEVDTINPPGAPWHMRLMARASLPAPEEYKFFNSDQWTVAKRR